MAERTKLDVLAKQLHDWYLEATELFDKNHIRSNYNPTAQVSYDALPEAQQFVDKYIAGKLLAGLYIHSKLHTRRNIDDLIDEMESGIND